MWRVASIYLNETRGLPGAQLSSPAYAVAAEGLLVASCSVQTASAPAASQPSPPVSSAQVTSPGHTQMSMFTSAMARFTLPARMSSPTVFSAGEELLTVAGLTTADTTDRTSCWSILPAGPSKPVESRPSRFTTPQAQWWAARASSSTVGRPR